MSNVRISLLACAALLATVASTSAQVRITGGIAGTVTDTSEAVIPGAAVVLKDEGTGITRERVTNGSGFFQFAVVPPSRSRTREPASRRKP